MDGGGLRRLFLATACLLAAGPLFAADGDVTSRITPMQFAPATEYEGAQHRALVQALFSSTDPLAQRRQRLQPVLAFCDGHADDDKLSWASVSNDAELKEFQASRPKGVEVRALDFACPWAYMADVFFDIEEQKAEAALARLDRIDALAPYMGWSRTERGFVLNAMGKRAEALAAYRSALQIARAHATSAYAEPISLRGIGWTLVELGDLEGARQAYVDSLKSDPGNANTQAEIDYIDRLRKSGAATPKSGAFGLGGVPKSSAMLAGQVRTLVQSLEADPFAADAKDKRLALAQWIGDSPEVFVLVCNSLELFPDKGEPPPYASELLLQQMAGNALWQLDNPGQKDSLIGQQAAGARSALKAYSAIRAKHPEVHFSLLDSLLGHEQPGELEKLLAPSVKRECSGEAPKPTVDA